MENIREHLEERLWNAVKRSYNSDNYKNAILDAIQFLGDVIREKSGLNSDGNPLIGSAFGGKNPKIKLNKLKSESELNVQKGLESILRGFYSAYRNPRSHSKIQDSEETAFEVIIFINHILKLIDKSKGKFTNELFMKRVFDNDFVKSKKYADLLVKEIPKGKYFDIAIEIYQEKESGKINNLTYVWKSIHNKLSETERNELLEIASEELRYTDSPMAVIKTIALFSDNWEKLSEDARLRAENKLVKLILNSTKDFHDKTNQNGIYVSWLTSIIDKSLLKNQIARNLYESLASGDEERQKYVIDYYGQKFDELESHLFLDSFKEILKQELKNGSILIYDFTTRHYQGDNEFDELHKDFIAVELDDGLPF